MFSIIRAYSGFFSILQRTSTHHYISCTLPLNSRHLIPHITLEHLNSGSELNSGPSSESSDSHSTSPGPHWHIKNSFYMITIELQYQGCIFNAHVLLPLIKIAQSHLTQSHMDIFSLKFHLKQFQSSGRVPSMIKGALKRVMLFLAFRLLTNVRESGTERSRHSNHQ